MAVVRAAPHKVKERLPRKVVRVQVVQKAKPLRPRKPFVRVGEPAHRRRRVWPLPPVRAQQGRRLHKKPLVNQLERKPALPYVVKVRALEHNYTRAPHAAPLQQVVGQYVARHPKFKLARVAHPLRKLPQPLRHPHQHVAHLRGKQRPQHHHPRRLRHLLPQRVQM